jgi:hypothetical protein
MKYLHTKYLRGYSLIELLVYISIFSLIAVVVVNSLIVSTKSFSETKTNRVLLHGGFDIMERVSREIRGAESIGAGSSFGVSPSQLILSKTTTGGESETTRISVESGVVNLYKNDVLQGALSDSSIVVEAIIFRQIIVGSARAVRIELTISNNSTVSQKNSTMYTTTLLRGSI